MHGPCGLPDVNRGALRPQGTPWSPHMRRSSMAPSHPGPCASGDCGQDGTGPILQIRKLRPRVCKLPQGVQIGTAVGEMGAQVPLTAEHTPSHCTSLPVHGWAGLSRWHQPRIKPGPLSPLNDPQSTGPHRQPDVRILNNGKEQPLRHHPAQPPRPTGGETEARWGR